MEHIREANSYSPMAKDMYIDGRLFLVFMYEERKEYFNYFTIKKYYHSPNKKDCIHIKTEIELKQKTA